MIQIAYSDEYGKDCSGYPWLASVTDNIEDARVYANRLKTQGCTNIIIFSCEVHLSDDIGISWSYVKEHKIEDVI